MSTRLLLALVALWLASSLVRAQTPASAAEKIRQKNAECYACHSEQGLRHPPKSGLDLVKLRGLLKDPTSFQDSTHQRLACTKCHNEGYDEHPHDAKARESTSTCSDCHSKKAARIEKELDKSVHAKNLADQFTCRTCHDPHVMRTAEKLADPAKIVAQDNRVCLGCHDSDEQFAKFAPEKKTRPLIDDIHSWLPNTRLHWKAVRCIECHTPAIATEQPTSHLIVGKEQAEKKCVACHSGDTKLKTSLYRHLAKDEQNKYGFMNSVILGRNYVIGATRHPMLDALMIGLAALTLLGVAAHAVLRIVAWRSRRSKHNE